MNKYSNATCPVCGKPFSENEDIVVCPDCGAPHHRECYQRLGHCALIENHKLGKNWDPPAEPKTESGNSSVKCPRCNAENPEDGIFCSSCGARLTGPTQTSAGNIPPFQQRPPLVVVCLRMGYLTEIFMAVLTPTKRWMASKYGICLNLLAAIPLIFCQIFPGLSDLDGLFPSISLRCFLDGNIFCIEKCTGFPCSFLLPIPF